MTGACGTIGKEIVRRSLEEWGAAECIGVDNNEPAVFATQEEFSRESRSSFFHGDVRDRDDLILRSRGCDLVFHTAALKHVGIGERSPNQVVETNVVAVQNVIAAATENGIERVLFTSSDKAVNPSSVMGASKLMGERLISSGNGRSREGGTTFASTRFGNVLGSSGSVVPLFQRQIARGGPVTITDRRMTRFVMSVKQAVTLLFESAQMAQGGEVFVTKMPVVRIEDLASVMIDHLAPLYGHEPTAIDIVEIGAREGEKLYEELMTEEETSRSWELEDYFVVHPLSASSHDNGPLVYENLVSTEVTNPYKSSREPALSREEVAHFLESIGLFHPVLEPNGTS